MKCVIINEWLPASECLCHERRTYVVYHTAGNGLTMSCSCYYMHAYALDYDVVNFVYMTV